MKLNIIRKKASSLKELGRELTEISAVSTLEELLTELVLVEFQNRRESKEGRQTLFAEEIEEQADLGRVRFPVSYQENMGTERKAVQVMLQDFKDGLFRVYINGEECVELKEKIEVKDGDEIVLLRFIMLAGRMW